MPFPAICVANEFLEKAKEKGQALSPMKLQKLAYFAHGWYLALTGRPLITERLEAWQYGPVIPALYHEFKAYGNADIARPAEQVNIGPGGKLIFETPRMLDYASEEGDAEQARKVIGRVFEVYGRYSATRLSNATHLPGTPWQKVYREGSRALSQ